jgi:hypothetical protein
MKEWFLEDLAAQARQKGLSPAKGQCVAYKIPIVFKESANMPDNIYVADLYEFVSFMGDLHLRSMTFQTAGRCGSRFNPVQSNRKTLMAE